MRQTSGEVPHRCARYLRLVGIGVVSMSFVRGTKRTFSRSHREIWFQPKSGHA